ncbi:STAS domain-containing protein [Arsukibacterium indicum]|uniref:STAS domain-containing protein n=1 Tax=Arsukibacterium indicum TaxID=2848612 RepID=A0ABS6MNP8_9GAMM|nr:STAS domain-containing protein [Arsukibacterium indicum]MBV2130170.1 STAS domain-containing protein [Arsukibacterium indicum]
MSLNIAKDENTLRFSGELNRDTLMLYSPFKLLNSLSGKVIFDFSALSNVDSAGLAWLIQQLGQARKQNLQLEFIEVPAQLLALAKVSGVTSLLPITD